MKLQALQYIHGQGWSTPYLPELDSENTLILIFGAPVFREFIEPIKELATVYKQSKLIGCSTAGEIFGSRIFDESLSVVIMKLDATRIKLAQAKVSSQEESFNAGQSITNQLNASDLRGIFVLSDGLSVNGSELVKGLTSDIDPTIITTGGLAGDGPDFKNTWIIYQGEIMTSYVVAVGFYGEHICIGHASKGGWDIFGPSRHITRSVGNVLYELDNQPALLLYKEYLGERANELPASGLLYPLAIYDISNEQLLVRTILAINEKDQSLTFAGDMPTGYYAKLMRANFDRLITSASEAGEIAKNPHSRCNKEGAAPLLAIDISCIGRRLLLGERTEEETESTLEALPKNTTQVGFYSYGELSPFTNGNCELHNQTMTITTFSEQVPGKLINEE